MDGTEIEMSRIAASKLEQLLGNGWHISGVAIEKPSQGKTLRGAVTAAGMVLWWHEETIQAMAHMRALLNEAGQALKERSPELSSRLLAAALPWQQRPADTHRQCAWHEEDDLNMPGTWSTSCGELWTLTDGTPTENRMAYCHHCGGRISLQARPKEPAEDTEGGEL